MKEVELALGKGKVKGGGGIDTPRDEQAEQAAPATPTARHRNPGGCEDHLEYWAPMFIHPPRLGPPGPWSPDHMNS